MAKKEWPLQRWAELYQSSPALAKRFYFSSGPSEREQSYLEELEKLCAGANVIRKIPSIAHLMAIIHRASLLVCGDSVPGHLAAGLGTPVLVLFGPTSVQQWAPRGDQCRWLWAGPCDCFGHPHTCHLAEPCIARITAEQVKQEIQSMLQS